MQRACELSFDRTTDDTLRLRLSGSWTLGAKAPPAGEVFREAKARGARRIGFDARELIAWDSVLLTFLLLKPVSWPMTPLLWMLWSDSSRM